MFLRWRDRGQDGSGSGESHIILFQDCDPCTFDSPHGAVQPRGSDAVTCKAFRTSLHARVKSLHQDPEPVSDQRHPEHLPRISTFFIKVICGIFRHTSCSCGIQEVHDRRQPSLTSTFLTPPPHPIPAFNSRPNYHRHGHTTTIRARDLPRDTRKLLLLSMLSLLL